MSNNLVAKSPLYICVLPASVDEWDEGSDRKYCQLEDLDPQQCVDNAMLPYEKDHLYGYKDGARVWWISEFPVCPQIGWGIFPPFTKDILEEILKVKSIFLFSGSSVVWINF